MLPRDLSPASFRGVRFLVPSDRAEAGRNAIRHAYPDASYHYLEDNGVNPPEFKVSAILHGNNLPAQFSALRAALMRPGPGLLKHPYWGRHLVMVDGKFSVKRDDREAGVLEIEIPFSVTGPPALPGAVSGVAAYVTSIATSTIAAIFQSFADRYDSPLTSASASAVGDVLRSFGSTLNDHFASAGDGALVLERKATRLAGDGNDLAGALAVAVQQPIDETDAYSASDIAVGFAKLAGVANAMATDALAIPQDTLDRVRRRNAITVLCEHMQAVAFVAMADGMASKDYATANDVARDEDGLMRVLDRIQECDLEHDLHQAILGVYTAASEVLATAAVRKPRVADMRIQPIPASVLSYMLYESDGHLPTLVTLNLAQSPILLVGDVAILKQQG